MTTNMITAARLIAHKTVNGRYQSTMAMVGCDEHDISISEC